MTGRIYLNDGWKFAEQYDEGMLAPEYGEENMKEVRLPHTCKETPFHYFDEQRYQMVCAYRRVIAAPKEWKGQKAILTVEGAAHESEVFLNGEKIGEHHCGYTAFSLDLTEKLRYGQENILVIKVDSRENLNIPPFGFVIDYMTYGGLYREVYLDIKNPCHLQDVFVRTEIQSEEPGRPKVISKVTLSNTEQGPAIRQSLQKRGETEWRILAEVTADAPEKEISCEVEDAALWDTEHPNLYELKTELVKDGSVLDEKVVTFGFRKAEFRTDGFYLNGKKLKIRGLNRHQSYPYVGYAMPKSMQRMDADVLKKELGVNAVRTSHYPQSHYFLDRCDELGLLVFTEIPGWQHIGDEEWKRQAVQNVRDMVLQYRNYTSVILWGVRINESQDDDAFYLETNAAAHELDPFRQTGGVRANKKSSLLEDVYTYNDFSHDGRTKGCEKKAHITSRKDKPYLITEYNGHMFPTKAYDCEEHRKEHALRHANVLDAVAGEEDIAGSFGWCMADYNTHKDFGSGDRICYHGVLDMFRNPKMAAQVYASQHEDETVLAVSSSMDIGEYPGSNRGDVYIFTNADSVRMYKNDRFIKEYSGKDSPYRNLKHGPILVDDFLGDVLEKEEHFKPAQARALKKVLGATAKYGLTRLPKSVYPAILKLLVVYRMKMAQAVDLYTRYIGDWGGSATAYRFDAVKGGKVVKSVTKTPMTALMLQAEADHTGLVEKNTYDVAAVRIKMLDENRNQAHFYNGEVIIETEGPIEIIGPKVTTLQGGMGGTYIRTTGKAGDAVVKLRTMQGEEAIIRFTIEA